MSVCLSVCLCQVKAEGEGNTARRPPRTEEAQPPTRMMRALMRAKSAWCERKLARKCGAVVRMGQRKGAGAGAGGRNG